ncbi:hypothetical protein HC928_02585 [bacterium]|nr:hypothetical protein [bacterium]
MWTLIDVPIRSALVRGTTGVASTFTFTPDVKGTYLVSLRVNGSDADVDNAQTYLAIRSFGAKTLSWRYKARGEVSADNEDYPGLGFPSNINIRGWATDEDLVYEEVEETVWETQNAIITFAGTVSRLVMTDAATGRIDPSLIPGGGGGGPVSRQAAYDGGIAVNLSSGNTPSNTASDDTTALILTKTGVSNPALRLTDGSGELRFFGDLIRSQQALVINPVTPAAIGAGGHNITINAGIGAPSDGSTVGGAGGIGLLSAGAGGATATAQDAGDGGLLTVRAGQGGSATILASGSVGDGGDLQLFGGDSGQQGIAEIGGEVPFVGAAAT